MRFTCRSCGRTYIVAQELTGLAFKMKCKTCGQVIAVRPADPPPAQVTAPPVAPVASPPPSPPGPSGTAEARPQTDPPARTPPEPPKAPPPARIEGEAPPAEVAPALDRPAARPPLNRPTFVLGTILAVLVAVYFYLNRNPAPQPAQRPVATPVQVAPRPEASEAQRQAAPAGEAAPSQAAPSPAPASRTTVGTRLP